MGHDKQPLGGNGSSVTRINASTGRVVGTPVATSGVDPQNIVVGEGGVWISNSTYTDGSVTQLNASTGQVVRNAIKLGSDASGDAIAAGAGSVWVADEQNGRVTRIKLKTR